MEGLQTKEKTRIRPASASSSSSTGSNTDGNHRHSRLNLQRRLLPVKPGTRKVRSSSGDLAQELDSSIEGDLLIHEFSKAIKSGQESARKLKLAETENLELKEEVRALRRVLDRINLCCGKMHMEYEDTPPREIMKGLKQVQALTKLDHNLLSSAFHNAGTAADVESISSSSSSHSRHKVQNGPSSDEVGSCAEESVAGGGSRHKESNEVCPANTDVE